MEHNVFIWKHVVITMRAVGDEFLSEEFNSASTAVLPLFFCNSSVLLVSGEEYGSEFLLSRLIYIYIYIYLFIYL